MIHNNLPPNCTQDDLDSAPLPAWTEDYLQIQEERLALTTAFHRALADLSDRSEHLPVMPDFDGIMAACLDDLEAIKHDIDDIDSIVRDHGEICAEQAADIASDNYGADA